MKKNPTTISVVAAALLAADGKILMQQRSLAGQHGGLWEFPGGKIEPGESPRAALFRELAEELGIRIDPAQLEPVAQASDLATGVAIELFACRIWQGDPQCLDGEALGWFDWETLFSLPMPPLDLPLARALHKALDRAI